MFYGNADDFESYFTERGFEIPSAWDEDKINSALLVSSEWLDNHYDSIWIGYKVKFGQERAWPRQNAMVLSYPSYTYKTNEIPVQVVQATYELAKRELTSPGSLSPDYEPVKYSKVSIKNAVSVEYNPAFSSAGDFQTQIPAVQSLMNILIDPTKNAGDSMTGKAVRV